MRLRERRESGEQDLFRSRLDQIIDTEHAPVKLARTIDWGFLEEKLGAVYSDGAGQPPLHDARDSQAHLQPQRRRSRASYGLRILITNTSAARNFSSTGCRSIAPR
jgi:hypothetical protein